MANTDNPRKGFEALEYKYSLWVQGVPLYISGPTFVLGFLVVAMPIIFLLHMLGVPTGRPGCP